ncbi:hypothetical protein [Streptomyces sp. DH24]|uniref:hypothetical protein n=1 Tax=Streptomyces sp. DH24 TaxID=3040123 RepID=UPI002442D0B9|nr:hypothetical protein [Streptomyces sp. DH24]MDG9717423.1 hypothetical protein [Streptomyces sp. DH24]
MSDLEKAAREAVEAADNTRQVEMIAAVLAAQQILAAQQQPATVPARAEFNATKWLVIGGVTVSIGLVGALFAVAIAIGGVCATACLLVLRSMWRDAQQKGR